MVFLIILKILAQTLSQERLPSDNQNILISSNFPICYLYDIDCTLYLTYYLFLNDLFLFIEETQIFNFSDDNTVYSCDKTIEQVALKLEHDIPRVLNWLKYNSMVANPAKFQVMFLGIKHKPRLCININGNYLPASDKVKLLGVRIDCKLNFNSHVENLCKRSNQKINSLSRIRNYHSPEKTLCNAYIISPFKYCPLIWTFCSNICTKKVQKRMISSYLVISQYH